MFGALKRGFRSMASLILVRNVVGELQPKRTLAALRGFLAAARLSCFEIVLVLYCVYSVLTNRSGSVECSRRVVLAECRWWHNLSFLLSTDVCDSHCSYNSVVFSEWNSLNTGSHIWPTCLSGATIRASDFRSKWSRVRLLAGRYQVTYVNSAFHPSGVGKSSISLNGRGYGGVCSLVSSHSSGNIVWSHMASDTP